MIILGTRGHYCALGGVENSIRNLASVAVGQAKPVTIVCREAIKGEILGDPTKALPPEVNIVNYKDDAFSSMPSRLWHLSSGGKRLSKCFQGLHFAHPSAEIIVRNHYHVLAASRAGFSNIRYLVPSLVIRQQKAEQEFAKLFDRIKLSFVMAIDSMMQKKAIEKSRVFVFSDTMAEQISNHMGVIPSEGHIDIVRPGVDDSRFKPAKKNEKISLRESLLLPLNKNLFLFVGRFVHAKGLIYAIEAMRFLPTDCVLVLVGDGEQKDMIRSKVKSLGVEDQIVFAESTLEVENYYRACDVFVMSSTYEPLGQTILEAAACGMPVVAFHRDSGAITATHELEIGVPLLFARQMNTHALAQSMRAALTCLNTFDVNTVASDIHKKYGWQRCLMNLLQK